jgi:transposase
MAKAWLQRAPPGKRHKLDEVATKLLAADFEARPAVTLEQRRERLERATGVGLSEPTISRAIRRLGWS